MSNEIKKIPFENGELLGVKTEDGKVWLGVKKACLDIGMTDKQADNEIEKIKSSLLFNSCTPNLGWIKIKANLDTRLRETIVLSEKFVPMWLAQISLTPTMQRENPQAVKRLLRYQLNAADVLHEAFIGTEEKKQEFYDGLGIKGEIIKIEKRMQSLEETVVASNDTMKTLINNTTINSRQAQKLLFAAKARVSTMLGGAHSQEYKDKSRLYFKNLWLDLCERYEVNTYKDLNPIHMDGALDFIGHWSYVE